MTILILIGHGKGNTPYTKYCDDPTGHDVEASSSFLGSSSLDTGFEGWSVASSSKLYDEVFKAIEKGEGVFSTKVPLAIKTCIEQLVATASIPPKYKAQEAYRRLSALEVGKSYVMEGGWAEIPQGHVMLYRFERTGANQFAIYIYNAQEGSEYIQGGLCARGPQVFPYTCFKDVTWEELFFCKRDEEINPVIFVTLASFLEHIGVGLLSTAILLPRLTLQFTFNAIPLAFYSLGALFSSDWRDSFKKQCKESFVDAPARALAPCLMIRDYVRYKRLLLQHGGDYTRGNSAFQ